MLGLFLCRCYKGEDDLWNEAAAEIDKLDTPEEPSVIENLNLQQIVIPTVKKPEVGFLIKFNEFNNFF